MANRCVTRNPWRELPTLGEGIKKTSVIKGCTSSLRSLWNVKSSRGVGLNGGLNSIGHIKPGNGKCTARTLHGEPINLGGQKPGSNPTPYMGFTPARAGGSRGHKSVWQVLAVAPKFLAGHIMSKACGLLETCGLGRGTDRFSRC